MLRKITRVLYAGILSLGCSNSTVAKYPLNPSMVNDYKIDVDSRPWEFSEVNIYPNKYCYYAKKNYNGDDLVIEDTGCDKFGDRLVILRGNNLIFSGDFKKLGKATQGNLNALIRKRDEK